MRKAISILLLLSFVTSNKSYAQTVQIPSPDSPLPGYVKTPQNEQDPGKVLSPLRKGQKSPFTGILLSPSAAADVIVNIETFEERLHIEVVNAIKNEQNECEKKVSDEKARLETKKKEVQSESDGKTRKIDFLTKELEKAKSDQASRGLWFGLGAVGGITLTLLTVFAASQATK